jgi:signal peptidase II
MADPTRKRRLVLVGGLALLLLALDLWSKAWAWHELRGEKRVPVIDGFAYWEFGFNTGAAFSLLADTSYARFVFLAFSVAALAYLVRLATKLPTERAAPYVAIALVLSGVLGNLHDRLFRYLEDSSGERTYGVVDFVRVYYWPGKPWPIFNVADVALVAGVILLVLVMPKPATDAATSSPAPTT